MNTTRRLAALTLAVVSAFSLSACEGVTITSGEIPQLPSVSFPSEPASDLPAPVNAARVQGALDVLDTIPAKGRAPMTGYDRDLFGARWTDDNMADLGGLSRNGCDTRNDILARDLADEVLAKGGCKVLSGTLADPYTGTVIDFLCGADALTTGKCESKAAAKVQIEHTVALGDAWAKGAQGWSEEQRTAFANDPMNLQAVDGPANMGKGAGDAATWQPANKAYRCEYNLQQVEIKAKYGLWMTQAEKDAVRTNINACPVG